jgi:hypothetical protein
LAQPYSAGSRKTKDRRDWTEAYASSHLARGAACTEAANQQVPARTEIGGPIAFSRAIASGKAVVRNARILIQTGARGEGLV